VRILRAMRAHLARKLISQPSQARCLRTACKDAGAPISHSDLSHWIANAREADPQASSPAKPANLL